jgi:predicted transposase YbfD/YdcC
MDITEADIIRMKESLTGIALLLDLIDIRGDVVRIDAMGCQTAIAEKIRKEQVDFHSGGKREPAYAV